MNFFSEFFNLKSRKKRSRSSKSRLQFQPLESRRLLAAVDLRFVTYNALDFRASSGDRQDEMEIIFNELDADVLAIQEITSLGGANILLAALNSNGQQYASANFVDGNDTDNLLFYKTAKVDLVSQNYLTTSLREIGEFTISVADTLINIYNVHLKASTGESNEQRRLEEVTTLRTHLESLPADREFIVAGDTNIYTSSEPAYQKLIGSESNNNGRVEDLLPPNLVGNWHANPAYSIVHSQSPRTASFGGGATGGLDDRFDMIFASYGLNDNIGLEYVADSYFVFGNDGQHFNQSLLAGSNSAVSPAVAQALHDASDHLPVVADFQVESPVGVTLVESGGNTSTSESGGTDSYQVVLDSVPEFSVTVLVTPDIQMDLGNGAGVPIGLTFTPGNALQSQTISVSAIDDTVVEGTHSGLIQHLAISSDTQYNGIPVDSVSVSIFDNDGSTAPSSALLNEVYVNTPGVDTNREYVEIAATPSTALTDLWLLEIEGDGANAGVIDNAQDLSSIVVGSNGLVLLGENYLVSNPWSSLTNSETTVANLDGGTMENGSITLLLVEGFSGSVDSDLDVNNDGQLDFVPWVNLLDSVGWTDGGFSDHVYSSAVLNQFGTPDAATRIDYRGPIPSAADWFNGDIVGVISTVTYGDGSTNLPGGAVLTPGAVNFGVAPPVLLGDVNLDGVVNFLDISPFISLLSSGVFQAEADLDNNGLINFLDISPFIATLSS